MSNTFYELCQAIHRNGAIYCHPGRYSLYTRRELPSHVEEACALAALGPGAAT